MFYSPLPARHPLSSINILSISGRRRSASLTRQTELTSPPSIRSAVPVIQRAVGETMNAIKSAISSASPKRLMPACLRNCRLASSSVIFLEAAAFSSMDNRRLVMIAPGETLLTWTPSSMPRSERCLAKGETTLAREVHHGTKCHDNVELQVARDNLEALCQPHHAPLSADDRRGFSRVIDHDGYYLDPNHPSNRR